MKPVGYYHDSNYLVFFFLAAFGAVSVEKRLILKSITIEIVLGIDTPKDRRKKNSAHAVSGAGFTIKNSPK